MVVGGVSRNCHWLCQRTLAGAVREDWNPDPQELALDAVNTVAVDPAGGGQREIDIKKYIKIEKIPGGSVEDCRVLKGVMFNKASMIIYVCAAAAGGPECRRGRAGKISNSVNLVLMFTKTKSSGAAAVSRLSFHAGMLAAVHTSVRRLSC